MGQGIEATSRLQKRQGNTVSPGNSRKNRALPIHVGLQDKEFVFLSWQFVICKTETALQTQRINVLTPSGGKGVG